MNHEENIFAWFIGAVVPGRVRVGTDGCWPEAKGKERPSILRKRC